MRVNIFIPKRVICFSEIIYFIPKEDPKEDENSYLFF